MTTPEPTPAEKALKRVLLISAIDGWGVIALAGLGSLLALALGDLSSLVLGLLIVGAGIVEIRGRRRLLRRDVSGMRLLVRTQMFLLAVILVYCVSRLGSFDPGLVLDNLTPDMEAMLKENGVERADIVPAVRMMFYAGYGFAAFLTLLFQGGLAFYYRRKTALVTAALSGSE
jgi:hypothetical protein